MELINILISPETLKSTCSLCLKCDFNSQNMDAFVEIHDEYSNFSLSLYEIIADIIPSHDLITRNLCNSCADAITRLYSIIHRSKIKQNMFLAMINNLNSAINIKYLNNSNKCYLNLNINQNEKEQIDTNEDESFECDDCEIEFASKENLAHHIKSHIEIASICEICQESYSDLEHLSKHINVDTEKQCTVCLKLFENDEQLKSHLKNNHRQHRRKTYYNCKQCNYTTLCNKTLEGHINKIHLNIRPFVCEICSKGFYRKYNLTEHLKIHNGTRDKTCEVCGHSFCNKKALAVHLRSHSNVKPYECHICGKTFVTSSRRTDHVKRNHMEKLECCLLCDNRYGLKKELNRHMRMAHAKFSD